MDTKSEHAVSRKIDRLFSDNWRLSRSLKFDRRKRPGSAPVNHPWRQYRAAAAMQEKGRLRSS